MSSVCELCLVAKFVELARRRRVVGVRKADQPTFALLYGIPHDTSLYHTIRTIPHYTQYTTVYHSIPQYTTLYYTIPHYTHYTTLYTVYHSIPQYTTVYHSIPQYTTLYQTIHTIRTIPHYTSQKSGWKEHKKEVLSLLYSCILHSSYVSQIITSFIVPILQ